MALDTHQEVTIQQVRTVLEQYLATSDAEWEARLADLKAELMKWMFLFWAGPTFAIILAIVIIVRA